jgi:excisionase family DNA binding protein
MRIRIFDAWLRIMIADQSQKLLTKRDIARELQLGRRTIDVWMRQGKIPFLKIGKTVRFRLADVLEKLNAYRVN